MEWSFTMDADGHLCIRRAGRIAWEGSYAAFLADGDITPPGGLSMEIHERYDSLVPETPADVALFGNPCDSILSARDLGDVG